MLRMLLLIVAQVLLSLGGLYKIKTSSEIVSTEFMIGFAFYGISFLLWVYIIRMYALSIAFPIATSLSIVLSQLVGFYLLNESLGWGQIAAVLAICCGIFMLIFFK